MEALRILRLAKNSAVKARTQALNQLKAVLVNAPSTLREELEPLSTWLLVSRCAELVAPRGDVLRQEVTELGRRMTTTVKVTEPSLLARVGIGPDSAAALLIAAGDNPERLGSEASFAALCGVSPEQSSGKRRTPLAALGVGVLDAVPVGGLAAFMLAPAVLLGQWCGVSVTVLGFAGRGRDLVVKPR
nr:transposase [Streptomyces sp.]